jgi:hypothetical protein
MMKAIRSILLLPIHLLQGCFWLLWTFWYDDLSSGVAPIFIYDNNLICYLAKRHGKYCIAKYDLSTKNEIHLFETCLPIQKLIYDGKYIICSTYTKRGQLLAKFTINTITDIIYSNIVASTRDYILTTNPLSVIEVTSTCSATDCTFIISRVDELVRNQYDICYERINSFAVSECGNHVGYSTISSVSVVSKNGKSDFDISKVYFMKGVKNILLAYCRDFEKFIIINCVDMNYNTINLPPEFSGKFVLSASLSPEEKHIAFFAYNPESIGELVVLSVVDNKYRVLAKRARVYDIRWSPTSEFIATSGIFERDLLEIAYTYKMRNGAVNDKEIIDLNGSVVWRYN